MNTAYANFVMSAQERWLERSLPENPAFRKQARKQITEDLSWTCERIALDLQPGTILEVGAHAAEFSIAMKKKMPSSRVVAFEANPDVHARYLKNCQHRGVEYHFQCIAEENRTYKFSVPRTATREEITMGSLLSNIQSEDATTYAVQGRRLDDFLGEDQSSNIIWIDVEGAIGSVLDGAPNTLSRCLAVYAEVEARPRWEGQRLVGEVTEQLAEYGLFPVLRDVQRRTWQYNVLYLRTEAFAIPNISSLCGRFMRRIGDISKLGNSAAVTVIDEAGE